MSSAKERRVSRKQTRNLKKLKRKFGDFDSSDACNRCAPINSEFEAFIDRILGQESLSNQDKAQIDAALEKATDEAGNIDWGLVGALLTGVKFVRVLRWTSIWKKACAPGMRDWGKIDPNDPSSHQAWADRDACQAQKEDEAKAAPRKQVDIGTVSSKLPKHTIGMIKPNADPEAWKAWIVPVIGLAAALILWRRS